MIPRFWSGLACGAVSGLVTWLLTVDDALTGVAAIIAAVLVWLFGGIALAVLDG